MHACGSVPVVMGSACRSLGPPELRYNGPQLQLWSRTGTNGGNSFSQLYLRSKGMHVKASRSIRSSIQYTVFCFSTCTDKDFLNFHSFFFLSKVHVVYFEITDTQLLSNPANNSDMTFGIFFFSTPAVERKG